MKNYKSRKITSRKNSIESKENTERIKRLYLSYSVTKNKGYKELAKKIQDCEDDYPCNSLACSKCINSMQIKIINKYISYISNSYVFVTLIFYKDKIPINKISDYVPKLIKDVLRKKLNDIKLLKPIFGSLELDLHLYDDMESSYYLPHFHLLIPDESEKLEKLRNYMKSPKNLNARLGVKNRPMLVEKISDIEGVIKYITKIMWCEIPWYINKEGKLKHGSKRRISSNRLFSDSLVKLDKLKLSDIIFKCNFPVNKS